MKKIGILLPCYNEEDNVIPIAEAILSLFDEKLRNYECNIVFIDNNSTDKTVDKLHVLCEKHSRVKAILNAKNFRWSSSWHGIINTPGDCVICIPADFQVPVNTILSLVEKWENGAKIVCLIKDSSEEKKSMWLVRQLFYKISEEFSEGDTLPNFTGALYDREFIDICKSIDDPLMYLSLRSFICSHGYNVEKVYYKQAKRRSGKSSNNFKSLCYIALLRFTESSNKIPFLITISGIYFNILSVLFAIGAIIFNLIKAKYIISNFVLLCGVFCACSINMICVGILGEYLMKINGRLQNRPVVIEKGRINL